MKFAVCQCRNCGQPVAPIKVADGHGVDYTIHVDPATPVFVRLSDGEGCTFWTQDRSGEVAARHVCQRKE